jgi:predicted membrane-bound spermidine synthase
MAIPTSKRFYYLLSFIEGGSVMATELLGAKMLAPYFGSSLYVWATVLAITLGGLAAGYFAGGIVSYKSKNNLSLFYVLVAAAVFTMFMPFASKLILWFVGSHSLIPSVIVSAICILIPPVFMMGMVSPLIIKITTTNLEQSGKTAGAIYAISTVGGIIATFTFGFVIIPLFGLTKPCILTGFVLGIIPAIVLLKHKKIKSIGVFVLFFIWTLFSNTNFGSTSNISRVYETEGLLGQLMVLDYPRYEDTAIVGKSRWLFVNRISQTMYDSLADESKNEEKYFTYVYRILDYVDSFPKNSKVLLLGLGGGSVAKTLFEKGFQVDACELDKRIAMVARKYFYLSDKVNITIDDARHYIKNCDKKYDIIIFDTFKGEDPPNHVFTTESLAETKKILNPGGTIFVNSMGYLDGEMGKAMRSIYKTFLATDFNVKILPTDSNPDQRNLLFHASLSSLKPNKNYISEQNINLNDAAVLTDDLPILDILNAKAAMRWRVLAINSFNRDYNQQLLPIFE